MVKKPSSLLGIDAWATRPPFSFHPPTSWHLMFCDQATSFSHSILLIFGPSDIPALISTRPSRNFFVCGIVMFYSCLCKTTRKKLGMFDILVKFFWKRNFSLSVRLFFLGGEFSAKCFLIKNNLDNLSDRYSLGPCLIFLKEYKIFLGKWISMLTCGEK